MDVKNTHSVTKTEISVFGRQALDAERRRSPSLADKVLESSKTNQETPLTELLLDGIFGRWKQYCENIFKLNEVEDAEKEDETERKVPKDKIETLRSVVYF